MGRIHRCNALNLRFQTTDSRPPRRASMRAAFGRVSTLVRGEGRERCDAPLRCAHRRRRTLWEDVLSLCTSSLRRASNGALRP